MCRSASSAGAGSLPGLRGLDGQQVGQQAQGVLPAFAGLEDLLHPVGTDDHPDPVMVARRGKREQGGQFVDRIPFRAARRGDPAGSRCVHDQPDGQFALLDVAFDVRPARAGGHVPVDGPDFIAGMVRADLIEVHPPPLEHAAVLAGQQMFDRVSGAQLELAQTLVNGRAVAWDAPTSLIGTRSTMRSSSASEFNPSASAR